MLNMISKFIFICIDGVNNTHVFLFRSNALPYDFSQYVCGIKSNPRFQIFLTRTFTGLISSAVGYLLCQPWI